LLQQGPPQPGPPIKLTLSAAGGILTGTLTAYQESVTGPVQAALLDTGELEIGGSLVQAGTITQLRGWRLTLTRGSQLAGTLIHDYAFVNIYGGNLWGEQLQVDGLTRQE
jgi:hypothetical protein